MSGFPNFETGAISYMARKNEDSKTTQVYNILKAKVIDGTYPGGTFLVETAICEELGVSRTPVREAIIRLSNDYFVEIIPNRGAYIPHITLKDIVELYQLRIANDGMAAYLCVKNPPIGLVEQLQASVERETSLLNSADTDAPSVAAEDLAFHDLLISGCGNLRLINTIRQVENQMARIVRQSADQYALEHLHSSLEYHRKIVQAFQSHDAEEARRLTAAHWETALEGYIRRDIAGTLPRAL